MDIKTSDAIKIDFSDYDIYAGGKLIGKIKSYEPLTSTITFKRPNIFRKLWRWIRG